MPELPEVEIMVRHLAPQLAGRTINAVHVSRKRILGATSEAEFAAALSSAKFRGMQRRGKYIVFSLSHRSPRKDVQMLGHLGMTGRMYLAEKTAALPKHAAVVLDLDGQSFIFEDTRYFGRMTLDLDAISSLGPEPFSKEFSAKYLAGALSRSSQAIKVRLLDQSLIAGIGNIYASEALFAAGIHPETGSRKLTAAQVKSLHWAIQKVLKGAIKLGMSLRLDFAGGENRDKLFYFGTHGTMQREWEERFSVYDRACQPCRKCGALIQRIIQAARSTFFCPACQNGKTGAGEAQDGPENRRICRNTAKKINFS